MCDVESSRMGFAGPLRGSRLGYVPTVRVGCGRMVKAGGRERVTGQPGVASQGCADVVVLRGDEGLQPVLT